jgi:sec-independent protein translocase protein TatA
MFGGMGVWEILLVFLVVLLLFGAKRLPEIGSSLGKGIREFKGSLREIENELKLPDDRPGDQRRVQRPTVGDEVESTPRRLTNEASPAAPAEGEDET